MSYILDALKRAKAERDRGAAPSIHQAPPPQLADDEDEGEDGVPRNGAAVAGGNGNAMRWIVIGLSAALLLSLGWQFLGRDEAPPAGARDGRPMPPRDGQGPPAYGANGDGAGAMGDRPGAASSAWGGPGMRPPGEHRPPGLQGMPPGSQGTGMRMPDQAPERMPGQQPAPDAARQPLAPAPLPQATQAPRTAPAAPVAASAAVAPAAQELPEDLRRALAISGSRYSENPASRIVFINGQVFREGDTPAPGITIERIGLKSVILAGRGQHYELKY